MQSHTKIPINIEMKQSLAEGLVHLRKKQWLQIERGVNYTQDVCTGGTK